MVIIMIALAVALLLVIWVLCAMGSRCTRQEEAQAKQRVIELPNPSHDPPFNWCGEEPVPCALDGDNPSDYYQIVEHAKEAPHDPA